MIDIETTMAVGFGYPYAKNLQKIRHETYERYAETSCAIQFVYNSDHDNTSHTLHHIYYYK